MSVESRVAQAQADIVDVERQLAEGELDEVTAETLVGRYRREIDELQSETVDAPGGSSGRGPTSRRVVGTVLLGGALVIVAVLAVNAAQPRDGGFITGDVGDVDLDTVSNDQMEAVIAANADVPQVAAMRVALAERYFDESNFGAALPHYLDALNGQLDQTRRARALARIGWMSFVSGRDDLATSYLDQAVSTDDAYQEAHLFLGLVYLETCQPAKAIEELQPLASDDEIPADIRADIEAALLRANDFIASGACG